MSRTTIDFGIDLGTTNSAIALLSGTATDVIKNNLDHDITPSAVYIDKRGIHTGTRAKGRLESERSVDDVHVEFKRTMGTDHQYRFASTGAIKTSEELSAEVLKSLRADVQHRLGEDIHAAVITVPAAFEQRQCVATRAAASLAGLVQCPLVQEPVAAALAYGFQSDVTKEYWLIYDLGGGTFDAAIVKAEEGTISVVNHGGDNFLGGADIDWAIVEQIVIPELVSNFDLPDFSRANRRWRPHLARIKRVVELARIELSQKEVAYLGGCSFNDASGSLVDLDEIEFVLSQTQVAAICEPIALRSVEICKKVLDEKSLSPSAIEKMVLVGGPTLAPYYRDILRDSLGIAMDHTVDPLTVVARGAAVFAGTQRLELTNIPKTSAGEYTVDLKYHSIGPDEDPIVRGAVTGPEGSPPTGFTIEFVNQQTQWRSGRVELSDAGRFRVELLAEKGCRNIFDIELRDPHGARQATVPDELTYTIGMTVTEQPNTNTISVALANNERLTYFEKGTGLPVKATHVLRTTHSVQKGVTDRVLNVPVVEGEADLADRNKLLGTLVVRGTDIRRDVPAGSEIEVTLHINESRELRVKAYIPLLDEEFEAVIDTNKATPDASRLHRELELEKERLRTLRDTADDTDEDRAWEIVAEIDAREEIEALEQMLTTASGDTEEAVKEAQKAEARLLEMRRKLDNAEEELLWPTLVSEAREDLERLEALTTEHGDIEQRRKAEKLSEEIEELIEQKRAGALRRKVEEVGELHRAVLLGQDWFWLGFFNHLQQRKVEMRDPVTAERLVAQGHQCIGRQDVAGLRRVVAQLLSLIPEEQAEQIQRAYASSVQR